MRETGKTRTRHNIKKLCPMLLRIQDRGAAENRNISHSKDDKKRRRKIQETTWLVFCLRDKNVFGLVRTCVTVLKTDMYSCFQIQSCNSIRQQSLSNNKSGLVKRKYSAEQGNRDCETTGAAAWIKTFTVISHLMADGNTRPAASKLISCTNPGRYHVYLQQVNVHLSVRCVLVVTRCDLGRRSVYSAQVVWK